MGVEPDTIFAMATAPGRAGVAVLRLSGPLAGDIAARLAGPLPKARMASKRTFYDENGHAIDQGLLLWFPAPNSFTGESVAEFHLHGGRAVIEQMLRTLSGLPGTRPALAGEFTRRAFDHGKLDLTEVEGLADLVAAETQAQRRQALRQMEGGLGAIYESWRARLLQALAILEAQIDFSDEELPDDLNEQLQAALQGLATDISAHLADGQRGEILRRGFRIAILGAPNVGKSSLINALAQRDVAIVTPQAGTTRDVIEVNLDLGGYLVSIADTAGLRITEDDIEAEGIARTGRQAAAADLKLLVYDAGAWPEKHAATEVWQDGSALTLVNKIDLHPEKDFESGISEYIPVSLLTGAGVDRLLQRLQQAVAARLGGSETPGLTRERHRRELSQCQQSLLRALQSEDKAAELTAEDVRLAMRPLGRITGRAGVEDMLDVLFGEFCIGK